MVRNFRDFLNDERGDVGLVFKVIVGVVIGVAVLGLLLSMLNIVSFGTNEFAVSFKVYPIPPSGTTQYTAGKTIINPNGGCISLDGVDEKSINITGNAKNVRGGFVEGAQVEISGGGAQDLSVTDKNGFFKLKAEFNLGGTPFGTTTIGFKKDGFVRKDITIAVKKASC